MIFEGDNKMVHVQICSKPSSNVSQLSESEIYATIKETVKYQLILIDISLKYND